MSDKPYKQIASSDSRMKDELSFNTICTNNAYGDLQHFCTLVKKNEFIFTEGTSPKGVYCINEGKVKVFVLGDEGKEQIIHIAKRGEMIGFRAMFSDEPYRFSATTLEDCAICFTKKEDFLNMIETNPVLRTTIMKEFSKELSDRALFITNMAQKSVRERLAFSLLLLDDIYSDEEINLTREDLANFVGTATETLIRLLKTFKQEGIIEIHVRKLKIIDKNKLYQLAGR
jgi:CRP-like cAMP-binding protein